MQTDRIHPPPDTHKLTYAQIYTHQQMFGDSNKNTQHIALNLINRYIEEEVFKIRGRKRILEMQWSFKKNYGKHQKSTSMQSSMSPRK
uniref:Uncharacterized protein n=1 Tax=Anguilla anguilla TaxID=7936 RepID=A0A0E9X6S6_ANGAN